MNSDKSLKVVLVFIGGACIGYWIDPSAPLVFFVGAMTGILSILIGVWDLY